MVPAGRCARAGPLRRSPTGISKTPVKHGTAAVRRVLMNELERTCCNSIACKQASGIRLISSQAAYLVAALVSDDPQPGADGALQHPVRRPQQAPAYGRRDGRVAKKSCAEVQEGHRRQVGAQVGAGHQQAALEAVRRDGFAQLANSERRCGGGLSPGDGLALTHAARATPSCAM